MSLLFSAAGEGTPILINDLDVPPYAENRLAYRRSCDRCHGQKLKCSSSTQASSFGRCLRCTKAGLPCTFSTRSSRQGANQTQVSTSDAKNASKPGGRSSRKSVDNHMIPARTRTLLEDFDWTMAEDKDHTRLLSGHLPDLFGETSVNPEALSTRSSVTPGSESGFFDWDVAKSHHDPSGLIQTTESSSSSNSDNNINIFNDEYARKHEQMPKFPRAELVQYMISTTNVHEGQSFELNLMEQTSSLQQRLEKLEAGEVSDVPHSLDDLYNFPIGQSLQQGQNFLQLLKSKKEEAITSTGNTPCYTFNTNVFSETLDSDYFQSQSGFPTPMGGLSPPNSRSRKTTSTVLPLTCYVLLVQIIAHQSRQLCSFIQFLKLQPQPLAATLVFSLRDMHSPIGQPLSCIFRAIMSCIEVLKGIETELEIPAWLSVNCIHEDPHMAKEENFASKIVSALWECEAMRLQLHNSDLNCFVECESGKSSEGGTALLVLRGCIAEVKSAMKQYIGL